MPDIRIIADARGLRAYIDDLRHRGVEAIALDLEADQGSYRYRYSISIFQCFDGREPVILDAIALAKAAPTASGATVGLDPLRELLTAPDIVKVMFSAKNDLFIMQNVLGFSIEPLRDIAIAQKILGLRVNLSDFLKVDRAEKDGFQRANWLVRPIAPKLLQYAVGDVLPLLEIEAELRATLAERQLADRYAEACAALPRTDYRIDQYRQYENKFPGWKRLGPGQKDIARLIWIFRELVGERYDCPVGYILSTKSLPDLIGTGPDAPAIAAKDRLETRLEAALNRGRRPEKRLSGAFVAETLEQARKLVAGRTART